MRPDWDAVLTPVLDAMIARTDVDGARIAVIGVGEGGFWVPRALASERRPAAAVADPGVVDVSAAWTARLAEPMAALLRTGADAAFERELRLLALFDPAAAAALRARAAPYGAGLAAVARDYRLGDLAAAITTPLLVTGADGETRWPGQSQALYERLPGEKALADLGAGGAVPRETAIFDWLDRPAGRRSELVARRDAALLHRAVDVRLDRADGEHELVRDLGVAQPAPGQRGDLRLAPGERGRGGAEPVDDRRVAALAGHVELARAGCGAAGGVLAARAHEGRRRLHRGLHGVAPHPDRPQVA